MATLTELQTLSAKTLKDVGFNAYSTTDYTEAINKAQDVLAELLKTFHTTATFSTVSGTQSYDLSSNYIAMYASDSMKYTDSTGTKHTVWLGDYNDLRENSDLTTKTGTPSYFWINQNNTVSFYPTPDYTGSSNVTYDFYNYPTTLSIGSDESDYGKKYTWALAYLTAEILAKNNELYVDADRYRNMALLEIGRARNFADEMNNSRNRTSMEYLG